MGKSLLNKTSTKSKKRSKYSETPYKQIKEAYKFDLREQVIYQGGLYADKTGMICTVVSRSQNRVGKQYYKVEFEDGLIVETIIEKLAKIIIEEKEEV